MQDAAKAAELREQAKKCRRLADSINDAGAMAALRKLATEYESQAERLELGGGDMRNEMPPPTAQ